MKKEQKDKHFVKQAFFKGGAKALHQFVAQHLRYPKEALEKGVEGTIHAKYDIDHQGRVIRVHLLNRLGGGCDEEAERVIKLLQFEVPKTRGLRLTFHKEIHIHFKKPNAQNTSENALNVDYQVVPQKEPRKEDEKQGNLYHYTISF
jgi:protein TonB